jgi:hypothetical protein
MNVLLLIVMCFRLSLKPIYLTHHLALKHNQRTAYELRLGWETRFHGRKCSKQASNPITGLERPWGFQQFEAPRFQDSRHMKVIRLSAVRTGYLYPLGNIPARALLKRVGIRAETRFGLSEKWMSPFKSAGESVQSTAGSRGVRISGQTMDWPCSEAQCKSSGYTLQSPIFLSLPLPRVTVCHHISNGLYSFLLESESTPGT